ncbi:MAG: histidinol-phosphatase [Methanocorpusculum sp.]|nr:histidinol-phosphatase [Methanocorpusculum sp.]
MQNFDLHVHTTFSDGADTPETVVLRAIELGLSRIGISDHSFVKGAEEWCMREDSLTAYKKEIARLKEKYRGQIEVLCGIEQDILSKYPAEGFDYVIGSVHFIKEKDTLIPVDESADILQDAASRYFGDNIYALCSSYYALEADAAVRTNADIIGHFNLISKFNENSALFDESDARYVSAWQGAARTLLQSGVPFEINFGAVSRGYRTLPYPSAEMRRFILDNGGKFILSSDSHAAGTIGYGFERWKEIEGCIGFERILKHSH